MPAVRRWRSRNYPYGTVGVLIDKCDFEEADYVRFTARLKECLAALREVLAQPGFGVGPRSLGAELEMFLVDDQAQALPRNDRVRKRSKDARVTLEIGRFNMEVNATPTPLSGRPFTALMRELDELVATVRRAAAQEGARVAIIGILPTLVEAQLGPESLTDADRYRAINAGVLMGRGGAPLYVRIEGEDALALDWDETTLMGASTSFQLHLRVDPADFARVYNAAQVATAPVLALAGNSPLFLGRRLWDETRIALFKQAADDRGMLPVGWRSARVGFGHGWVRGGPLELFEESVALHPPLLPVVGEQEPLAALRQGEVPRLDELRLHHGTVWTWNRAVYDPSGGGHVRIEFRPFPAGPSTRDMLANGAFLVGLTLGLAPRMDDFLPAFPFAYAEHNFYRAAKRGLDAHLLWPSDRAPSPRPMRVEELLPTLLPIAERGLREAGVDATEASAFLGIIADRLERRITGARWQRRALAEREQSAERPEALRGMLERYLELSDSGLAVHEWPED